MTMRTHKFMVTGNVAPAISDKVMRTIADGSTTLYHAVHNGLIACRYRRRKARETLQHLVSGHEILSLADKGVD